MPISELQIEKKMPVPDHAYPLHKYVKEIYSKKIKRAHNTANNPQYPKEIIKEPSKDRVQFTIIGHRFSESFIQTVHVAQGLHKYRSKKFDAPIIRGVTGVEWPKVWNDCKIQYGDIVPCIRNPVIVLINGKLLGGTEEFNEFVETKYYYRLKLDLPRLCVDEFVRFVKNSGRPCAYMHISINKKHIGTLIFMLYADLVPLTCENFLRLCNEKKGGYSGTPVHRIVKDCWIQCGGFGLKNTDLDCENFSVPHDRRGVLCMANDGRHIDCSTQFFVLLQPAPWMAYKYVAFGQLIEGNDTLNKIESIPTWYESPTREIIITDSGILNLECQDIAINKGTIEYLEKHVEDLIALGDWLIEIIIEKFFLELEFQHIAKLEGKAEDAGDGQDEPAGVHITERFIRKKEDIHRDIEVSQNESAKAEDENNDFDVESYTYEAEEEPYKHVSLPGTPSVVVKPMKPYYLAFTDVPYPGEIDSTHDLKKFLKGHYCLESDLLPGEPKKQKKYPKNMGISYHSGLDGSSQFLPSVDSLNSDDEREIKRYLKYNVDRVSFAGGVVRNIAKGIANTNFYEGIRKSEMMTEEDVRILRQRLACIGGASRPSEVGSGIDSKKVSIAAPDEEEVHKINRRQTGFMRPIDLEKFYYIHHSSSSLDDNDSVKSDGTSFSETRKVRIASSTAVSVSDHPLRRPTGYVKGGKAQTSDSEVRQSVLTRLYDDVTTSNPEFGPTLKKYKSFAESRKKNMFLTISPTARIKNIVANDDKYYRRTSVIEDESFEQMMNMQHGKTFARKISSDYVTTIDQFERKMNTTLRSVEYAKTRPTMTVAEYQRRKQLFKETSKDGRDDGKIHKIFSKH